MSGEALYERYKDALRRGHVASLRGRLEEALTAYAEAAAIAPERATPHTSAGTALMRRKRPADAVRHYAAAIRLAPHDEAALLGRAQALTAMGSTSRRPPTRTTPRPMRWPRTASSPTRSMPARRGLELAEGRERRRTLEQLIDRLRASEPAEPGQGRARARARGARGSGGRAAQAVDRDAGRGPRPPRPRRRPSNPRWRSATSPRPQPPPERSGPPRRSRPERRRAGSLEPRRRRSSCRRGSRRRRRRRPSRRRTRVPPRSRMARSAPSSRLAGARARARPSPRARPRPAARPRPRGARARGGGDAGAPRAGRRARRAARSRERLPARRPRRGRARHLLPRAVDRAGRPERSTSRWWSSTTSAAGPRWPPRSSTCSTASPRSMPTSRTRRCWPARGARAAREDPRPDRRGPGVGGSRC